MEDVVARITNKYERPCAVCGDKVRAFEGVAEKLRTAAGEGTWRTRHEECGVNVGIGLRNTALYSEGEPAPEQPHPSWARPAAHTPAASPTLEELSAALEDVPFVVEGEAIAALMTHALESAVQGIADTVAAHFTSIVPTMIADGIATARPLSIQIADAPPVTVAHAHAMLPTILTAVCAGASPMLVGPAGSGKTTLAQQVAQAMGRPFYMAARVTSEYKLTGYNDATGRYVRTQFRDAYELGGIFLFDEIDASDPDALTTFNAALAGSQADFPDGMVQRHEHFAAIAAGNTFGRGADRQYVGRNQLDAATLDRFVTFDVDYDETLELALAGNDAWTRHVQAWRHAAEREKVRHVISPRASIVGARMLAAGMAPAVVADAVVWKGLDPAQRARIEGAVR